MTTHVTINEGRITVHRGPFVIREGRWWYGIATGTRWAKHRRRTYDRALADAQRMEPTHPDVLLAAALAL